MWELRLLAIIDQYDSSPGKSDRYKEKEKNDITIGNYYRVLTEHIQGFGSKFIW